MWNWFQRVVRSFEILFSNTSKKKCSCCVCEVPYLWSPWLWQTQLCWMLQTKEETLTTFKLKNMKRQPMNCCACLMRVCGVLQLPWVFWSGPAGLWRGVSADSDTSTSHSELWQPQRRKHSGRVKPMWRMCGNNRVVAGHTRFPFHCSHPAVQSWIILRSSSSHSSHVHKTDNWKWKVGFCCRLHLMNTSEKKTNKKKQTYLTAFVSRVAYR